MANDSFYISYNLEIIVKCRRLLPNTVPPPDAIKPEQDHGN